MACLICLGPETGPRVATLNLETMEVNMETESVNTHNSRKVVVWCGVYVRRRRHW